MYHVPEIRKKLLNLLLEELSSYPNARTNNDFEYVFNRTAGTNWDAIQVKRCSMQDIPQGNQLTEAIIRYVLNGIVVK